VYSQFSVRTSNLWPEVIHSQSKMSNDHTLKSQWLQTPELKKMEYF